MEQIALFSELPLGRRFRAKRRPCTKEFSNPIGEQLSFVLTFRTELVQDDDDQWVKEQIVKRTVSAKDATPIKVKAPSSVWDMAFNPVAIKYQPDAGKRKLLRVETIDGVTKCVPIMTQETDEWKEREQIRRAKQRPPKPTSAYRVISKRFSDLLG